MRRKPLLAYSARGFTVVPWPGASFRRIRLRLPDPKGKGPPISPLARLVGLIAGVTYGRSVNCMHGHTQHLREVKDLLPGRQAAPSGLHPQETKHASNNTARARALSRPVHGPQGGRARGRRAAFCAGSIQGESRRSRAGAHPGSRRSPARQTRPGKPGPANPAREIRARALPGRAGAAS